MTAGFRAVNQGTGFVQIDGTYKNLCLRSKGTISVSTNYGGAYRAEVTLPSNNAIVAFSGGNFSLSWVTKVSGQIQVRLITDQPRTITYYIFDDPANGQTYNINYGLIVRNPSTGETVFDSRKKYLKILDTIAGNAQLGAWPGTASRSYSGRTIALMVCTSRYEFKGEVIGSETGPGGGDGPGQGYALNEKRHAFTVANGTVQFNFTETNVVYPISAPWNTPPVQNQTRYAYLIIDVTGY